MKLKRIISLGYFILLISDAFSQLVLCSFESANDIKSVRSSSGVVIRQTQDYAALNAHALQCSFPDNGGSVTIQQFNVPSWSKALGSENSVADALLLFVWSVRPGSVTISVKDSSAHIAADTFMLKAGANHLQLPFKKLAKINTEKIQSFSISSSIKAELYIDYIALDLFQSVLTNNGRWDVSYSNAVQTAHFPWGTDFINGKINTYSISPVFDGRGIIELSERLGINYKVTTIGRDPGINRWGFGDFYNRRNPLGDDGENYYSLAFNYIADDLLTDSSFDVIIWPGLHPWETYPQYIRDSVMKRVAGGTGLVLLYPSGKDTNNFNSISPLTISASVDMRHIDTLNKKNFGAWQAMDTSRWFATEDHYITRGIELNAFPFGSIGVLPFSNNSGNVLIKTAQGNPVIAIKNYGKGRVVAMAYEENGFIPKLRNPWETGLHNAYWEYMWSMVSRSVIWAAAKEPQTFISKVVFQSSSFLVNLNKINAGDSLSVEIEDEFGGSENKIYVALKKQDSTFTVTLPVAIHGGSHIANFYLKGKKVYDWYSLKFLVEDSGQIVSIKNISDELPAGQPVQSSVTVFAKAPFAGRLVGNLYDNYNRLVQQKEISVQFSGSSTFDVTLDSKNILSHLGRVEFLLLQGDKQSDRKSKDIFFLQPRKWDDYDVTLYHFGPNPVPGTWNAIDSQLQNMQVTTLAAYTIEQSRHANYKVQAQTRISGVESPDNGPDLDYYDSIKNRYLQTGDKMGLIRKYGLNDSSFLRSLKTELQNMVPAWRKFSPSAYYIYEEPSVTRYDDALDLDFSPVSLTAFRKWLQHQYLSLEILNSQWGTFYKLWEEVIPDDTKEAQQRGNYSSWADHRSFMEKSWADQFKYVQTALHEIDPEGLVQLSGTQASGAHNGYDYSQIDKHVGQMNPYDIGNQLEYHHDFNPALKISGQAGYGASGKSVLFDFYQHIFVNETGGAYIFWQQSALNPDLRFCKSGLDMVEGFGEMRGKGIGKLVASAVPENENRIAIHYSYPSIHAAWIVDGKIKPGHTYGNTSETLEQFRRNLDGWVKILQDAGLGFDFTAYTSIENGDLISKRYKTLILPMSAALSDEEVRQIELFVKNGGTIIADGLAGIMDGHARFRKGGGLANVFGIAEKNYSSKDLITPSEDKNIKLKEARSLSGTKRSGQSLFHVYGKGSAFMLNYFLDQYPEQKAKQQNDAALRKIKIIFSKAGITPAITFTDSTGRPVSGISKYSFTYASSPSTLLGLLPDKNINGGNIIIHLDTVTNVYDVRNNIYLGKEKNIKVNVRPWVPTLLAFLSGTIDAVHVDSLSSVNQGEEVKLRFKIAVSDSMKLNSVVNIAVYDPLGKKINYYGGNCAITDNSGEFTFSTALNDLKGKWKVVVREVISGKTVSLDFNLRTVSESLLPVPMQSTFTGKLFSLNQRWTIDAVGLDKNIPALQSLREQLTDKFKLKLPASVNKQINIISLIIKEGAVKIENTTDTNRVALLRQAYSIDLSENKIIITANAPQGLYYGVQSLVQLIKGNATDLSFPEGRLVDWPEMNLRMIYWDDAHHLEKIDVLRREIRQASMFKINGFAIKLEGHFQYASAKPIVEPYALSAIQFQELTDYAAAHYVQLVPYLDAPAHVSFILKHPEYKDLRAFPNSNYQFTVNNPKTYQLLSGMFKELINANKGVEYVLLSNDEAYYTGKAANETDSARALGGNGKLLAQFIGRMADTLKQYGRKVIFWGEYPLTPDDIQKLPRHLINGVYDSNWAAYFKQRGIRQLIYASTQGEEPLFPNYYPLNEHETIHAENAKLTPRVSDLLKTITDAISDKKGDLGGVIIAGWADAGLHPGTFWLGYATGGAMGWNHLGGTPAELSDRFYANFYRGNDQVIKRIYELTSRQAQFYEDSWEWEPSSSRKPIFGNHAEIYSPQKPALDQTLLKLPVPDVNNLTLPFNWADSNTRRLELTTVFLKESDELLGLLQNNKNAASINGNNINVIRTVATLCRQNIEMLINLKKINELLKSAHISAKSDPDHAVYLMDQCLDLAAMIKIERNKVLDSTIKVWYQDWLPLVKEANGRKYLHEVDDVKDHRPMRTADMSYLVYRELRYPLGEWTRQLLEVRNIYAKKHRQTARTFDLQWGAY